MLRCAAWARALAAIQLLDRSVEALGAGVEAEGAGPVIEGTVGSVRFRGATSAVALHLHGPGGRGLVRLHAADLVLEDPVGSPELSLIHI